MKYHIIPNLEKLDLYQALAKEYNLPMINLNDTSFSEQFERLL